MIFPICSCWEWIQSSRVDVFGQRVAYSRCSLRPIVLLRDNRIFSTKEAKNHVADQSHRHHERESGGSITMRDFHDAGLENDGANETTRKPGRLVARAIPRVGPHGRQCGLAS